MSTYTIPNVIRSHPRGDRVMDVYSHLLSERIVYLGTEIDDGVSNALIAQILHLESEAADQPIERIAQDSLRDRWYTAEQAVEYGFVDRVVQGSEELYGGTARPMTGLRVPA